MTKTTQLGLALLGTAITVVVVQYARDAHRLVGAPTAAAYGVQGGDQRARAAGRGAAEPAVVTPQGGAAMPATGTRPPLPSGEAHDPGDDAVPEMSEPEPTTVFGIPLPEWIDELRGRRRSPVAGGMATRPGEAPTATATTTASATAGASGCKHDPAPHPQGVTAELDFVGVLLNGQQREGESFTGAELDDVKILVEWKSLVENHAQRLDLIAPDGSLYQSFPRLVTAGDNGAPLETRVPINGTWITRYGLYGTWCVEVFLDEGTAPVTSSRLVIAKPQ